MSSDHLYAYGVVEQESLELDVEGVEGGRPVRTVDQGPLSAIVTDIDDMDPERSDENTRAHDEVLKEVMEHGDGRTVVPMQFGMTFKSARPLKSVLRSGRRAFRKAMNDVEGKVELGVKIVEDEDADLDRTEVEADVIETLDPFSDQSVEGDLFSDRLVVNRTFLVERGDQEAFSEAVGGFRERYDDRASIQYSGPWAPYSFVDIQVGAKR